MNEDKIIKRINDLIKGANPIIYSFAAKNGSHEWLFPAWSVQALHLFDSFSDVFDPKNRYLDEVEGYLYVAPEDLTLTEIKSVIEILKALKHDITNGYLGRYSTFVTAEVFNDFVEMSKHLCENDYLASAASLSAAVLEDSLRRIASSNKDISVEEGDTLGSLNQKCYGAKVYHKHHFQLINGWGAIRNDADHGHLEKFEGPYKKGHIGQIIYKKAHIEQMIGGIEQFLADHLK